MLLCDLQLPRCHGLVGLSQMHQFPVGKVPVIRKEVVTRHQGMNLSFQRTVDHILITGKQFSTPALPELQKLFLDLLLPPLFQIDQKNP